MVELNANSPGASSHAEHHGQFNEVSMARKDHYYNKAKQEGYRARSAYKLKQLDGDAGLFGPRPSVVRPRQAARRAYQTASRHGSLRPRLCCLL